VYRPVGEGSWSLDRDTAQDRDDARLMPPRASKCEGMGEIRRLAEHIERLYETARWS